MTDALLRPQSKTNLSSWEYRLILGVSFAALTALLQPQDRVSFVAQVTIGQLAGLGVVWWRHARRQVAILLDDMVDELRVGKRRAVVLGGFGVFAWWVFANLGRRMRVEDEMMHGRFGKEWEEWAAKVRWKLIPWVI